MYERRALVALCPLEGFDEWNYNTLFTFEGWVNRANNNVLTFERLGEEI